MNFTLIAALLLSLINLSKDLVKGFKENKIDIFLDMFLILITFIPCLFNLIYFLRRECFHYKILKINWLKFIKLDSYDEYYRNSCEKGDWIFCTMTEDHCKIDKNLKYGFITEYSKEKKLKKDDYYPITNHQSIDMDLCGISEMFNLLGKDLPSKEILKVKLHDNFIVIYLGDKGKINEFEIEQINFDQQLYRDFVLKHGLLPKKYKLKYMCFDILIKDNFVKIKHSSGRSKGEIVKCELNVLMLLAEILSNELPTSTGIMSEKYQGCVKMWGSNHLKQHYLSVQELISFIKGSDGFDFEYKQISNSGYILGADLIHVYDNYDCNTNQYCDLVENFETAISERVEDLNFYTKTLTSLEEKFGKNLANFLVDFTKRHFQSINKVALDFLINKSSCWGYRSLGKNWQSKRYLSDINFIFEKSGVPKLTHVDKNIPPTMYIQKMSDKIPYCTKRITRRVLDYNVLDINDKVIVNKRGKRQHENLVMDYCAHSLGAKDFISVKKLSKDLKGRFVEVTNDDKLKENSEKSPIIYNEHTDYRDALMKNLNFNRSNNKKIANEILESFVFCSHKNNIIEEIAFIKDLKRKLETHNPIKIKNKGFIQKNMENDIKLYNYFKILETQLEICEEKESKVKQNIKGVIAFVDAYYSEILGKGKNKYNLMAILRLRSNKRMMSHFKINGFSDWNDRLRGLDIACLRKIFVDNLKYVPNVFLSNLIHIKRHLLLSNRKKKSLGIPLKYPKLTFRMKRKLILEDFNTDNKKSRLNADKESFNPKECDFMLRCRMQNAKIEKFFKIEKEKEDQEKLLAMQKTQEKSRLGKAKMKPKVHEELISLIPKEFREEASDFIAVRRINENRFLRPYSDYTEEDAKIEEALEVDFIPIDEPEYPCVYKNKYYFSKYFRCIKMNFLRKYKDFLRENKDILYKVVFKENQLN